MTRINAIIWERGALRVRDADGEVTFEVTADAAAAVAAALRGAAWAARTGRSFAFELDAEGGTGGLYLDVQRRKARVEVGVLRGVGATEIATLVSSVGVGPLSERMRAQPGSLSAAMVALAPQAAYDLALLIGGQ